MTALERSVAGISKIEIKLFILYAVCVLIELSWGGLLQAEKPIAKNMDTPIVTLFIFH